MSGRLKPAGAATLNGEFLQLVEKAREISAQMERGQGETPISEALERLGASVQSAPLVIALLPLDNVARQTMVPVPGAVAEGGHMAEPTAPPLLRLTWVAPSNDLRSDNTHDHQRQAEQAGHVEWLVPRDAQLLWQNPSLYQQFCTTGQMLIVAADQEHRLSGRDAELLRDLVVAFPVAWPLVIERDQPVAQVSNEPWWMAPALQAHPAKLPPWIVKAHSSTPPAPQLSDPNHPLRLALQLTRGVRLLQGTIDSLCSRYERESKHFGQRQELLESPRKTAAPGRSGVPSGKDTEEIQRAFTEGIALLEKEISTKSERAVQPLGRLSGLMRETVSGLRLEDLETEIAPTTVKLHVGAKHLAAISRKIIHVLHEDMMEDVTRIQGRLKELTHHASGQIRRLLNEDVTFSLPPLHSAQIWAAVENLMAFGKESQIELPRKGFFDALTAGRQKVFIVIMFVSLMGRMGLPNLFRDGFMATAFSAFMILMFVSSVVSAVLTWRREKQTHTEKEMTRIKDSLFSEGCKVIEQVERGKLNLLRDYFKDVTRQFQQQCDRLCEQVAARKKTEAENELERLENRRRTLDARMKTLNELARPLGKLQENLQALQASTASALRDAVTSMIRAAANDNAATEPAASPPQPVQQQPPEPQLSEAPPPPPARPEVSREPPAEKPVASRGTLRAGSSLAQRREERLRAKQQQQQEENRASDS